MLFYHYVPAHRVVLHKNIPVCTASRIPSFLKNRGLREVGEREIPGCLRAGLSAKCQKVQKVTLFLLARAKNRKNGIGQECQKVTKDGSESW